jgi:uncharacterized protein (DUF433 family)
MVAAADLLGIGLYSPSEAALYARVRTQLISSWVYGNRAVIEPELRDTDDRIVTFLDFIQTLAIRRLRNERRVSLQKIREGYRRAREEFDVRYPFAEESVRIGLFGPPNDPRKQDVFLCLKKQDDEEVDKYFQLTGKKHGNQLIGQVVMTYARFLTYDPASQLACKYLCFKTDDGCVVMDPEIHFGEPFVEACGFTAHTLFNAYQTEGTIERAAKIYDVESRFIQLAIDYFDFLTPTVAA